MGAALALPRLRPDQWAIATHPAKVKVVTCGRRWGKSTLGGAIALSALAQGAKVGWMAPTYKNTRPLWRWAEGACGPLVRRGLADVNRTERTIEFPTVGGFLGVYSADNATAIRGEWFNLFVLDEAARIPEEVWTEVVQPALADADGDAILPSTPMGKNWYWREFRRGYAQMDGEIAAFTAPSSSNPNPRIQRAAALAKERVPDTVYRQEWLAEFVSESTSVFDPSWWDATEDHDARRYDANDQRLVNRLAGRWLSWDTAFTDTEGAAYSACVVGELTHDYRLIVREVWRDKVTFPNLMRRMAALAEKHNWDGKLSGVVIESKASGISAYQTLKATAPAWLAQLVLPFQPEGSKEYRAELAAPFCMGGDVWLPYPSEAVPWLYGFESELFAFPASEYKDQTDAFSQLIHHLQTRLKTGRALRQQAAAQLAAREREEAEAA